MENTPREGSVGGVYHQIARGLGRGTRALLLALIGGFVAGLQSVWFGVDPLGPILVTYTAVYALAYLAAILVDRSEADV